MPDTARVKSMDWDELLLWHAKARRISGGEGRSSGLRQPAAAMRLTGFLPPGDLKLSVIHRDKDHDQADGADEAEGCFLAVPDL